MTDALPSSLPDFMRAIAIGEDKTPESLHIADAPMPQIGAEEVLVRIGAAGVNRGDCMQRMGLYPAPPGAPDIMGLEFAGTIAGLGKHVSGWAIGDRVAALVASGSYADYTRVHHSHLLPVPDAMSLTDAAALPEAIFTVWANVFEGGALKQGETLLVHGGTSGIGSMAIQMGKLFGHQTLTTAGTDEKCAAAKSFGADLAINYNNEDFVAACETATNGKGVDVILDMVGGDYIARNMAAAAPGGRIVNIAYMAGFEAKVNFLPLMLKRLTLTGSTLRVRPVAEKARLTDQVATKIWPHIGGEIKPIIDHVYPLAEAGKAQAHMESGRHIGKIILDCA